MEMTHCTSCRKAFDGETIALEKYSRWDDPKPELLGYLCSLCKKFLCTSCKSKHNPHVFRGHIGQNTCSSCGRPHSTPLVLVKEIKEDDRETGTIVPETVALDPARLDLVTETAEEKSETGTVVSETTSGDSSGLDFGVRILITIAIAIFILIFYYDFPVSEDITTRNRWLFGRYGGMKYVIFSLLGGWFFARMFR